ncbi:type VII secretion protein EccB [Nocardia panacis]|uniref:Type VII secretion protein EccB n=1 Tax=Nocardia panacis TaxID=2340916 RepID=A0A3A4L0C1_9NOCA|nr:type VII secretion protein EccB [Nocardia panacis]RJO79845.1 type VII secretion protein EccB [Nocardia panacis]
MARFRVVTKHQISGWRFLLHRIEHALVRRDASMVDDPQRGRATALTVGVVLACVVIAGSAALAFFKPAKRVGDSRLVAEKDTGALFVRIGNRLHPALNLTSARLILGAADNPVQVSTEELSHLPRGPLVGIPGAPDSISEGNDLNSVWTVCDTVRPGGATPINPATGLPTTAGAAMRSTVIGGPIVIDGDGIRELANDQARLLRDDTTAWLVYRDSEKGIVRAAIDLSDAPVTLALGIDATAPVLPVSKGLIGAIPEVPPLRVPSVPGAGAPVTLASGLTLTVGSILTVSAPEKGASYYLVSQSGVVQISSVLAAMIRNGDTRGISTSEVAAPGVIAANLRSGAWPGTAAYPAKPVRIVDADRSVVSCFRWSRGPADQAAVNTLLVGRQLPLAPEDQGRPVELVSATTSRGNTADAAYLSQRVGRFVQVTGVDPASPRRESLFWISDSGVRYGIETHQQDWRRDPVIAALALRNPVPAPWNIVSLFAVGPVLSQGDARLQHDAIPPGKVVAGIGGPP